MLKPEIIREATRLTQAGQLVEATALLQRMLRGEDAADAFRAADRIALGAPSVVEATGNPVADRTQPVAPDTARPGKLRGSLDRAGAGFGFRGAARRAPPAKQDIVPEGARFIEDTYSNQAGSRSYRLFIPSGYHGQPIPLVVMLHGCTQSPEDFAAGTRMNFMAEERTCFVAYPAQRSDANQSKCWNWFRSGDQRRDEGEPSLIAGITRKVLRDYSVDPARVYVAGLSAGGAAAAVLGATYADLYAAIGVHSGLACGAAVDLPSAFVAMRQGGGSDRIGNSGQAVRTIVFHGDRDTTVHPKNGAQFLDRAMQAASPHRRVQHGQVPGGHSYTRTIYGDADGRGVVEHWNIHGAGHAWSGGSPAGSYTDPQGPDATREMLRFFLEHPISGRGD